MRKETVISRPAGKGPRGKVSHQVLFAGHMGDIQDSRSVLVGCDSNVAKEPVGDGGAGAGAHAMMPANSRTVVGPSVGRQGFHREVVAEQHPLDPDSSQFHIRVGDLALLCLHLLGDPGRPLQPPHQGRERDGAGKPDPACSMAAGITKTIDMGPMGRDQLVDMSGGVMQHGDEVGEHDQDLPDLRMLAQPNPSRLLPEDSIQWCHEAPHEWHGSGHMLELAMNALEG